MTTTHDIVAKLWNLCNVLRDDGITYHQYVTELTYLLFLKMAKETETERVLPEGYRWDDVVSKDGVEQLDFYRVLLVKLGSESSERVQAIFASASTSLTRPRNLKKLVESIDFTSGNKGTPKSGARGIPWRETAENLAMRGLWWRVASRQ